MCKYTKEIEKIKSKEYKNKYFSLITFYDSTFRTIFSLSEQQDMSLHT